MGIGNDVIAQSEEMGALPTLYAATQDIAGNSFVGPDGFQEQRGHPSWSAARRGEGRRHRARAVELSEELTGVSFPLEHAAA